MKLTIQGTIPSKKNSKQIFYNRKTNRPFLSSSKRYKEWHAITIPQLLQKAPQEPIKHATIALLFYIKAKYKKDLTNMAESIMDILVDAKILEDDNMFIIPELHLHYFECEKGDDRVEIEIEKLTK